MNTWIRVTAILHLCILFTLFASYAGYPFLQEMLRYKTYLALHHEVMGYATPGVAEHTERLARNRERFSALPEAERDLVTHSYQQLTELSRKPFWTKLDESIRILAIELPPFAQTWFLFSLLLCILLLFQIEGSEMALWILPLLVLCYAIDSSKESGKAGDSAEERLFPTEARILGNYLQEPLKKDVQEQYTQLQRGWHLYAIKEWAREQPSADPLLFLQQAERGEYAFNLARIQALPKNLFSGSLTLKERPTAPLLLLYFAWNCSFALLSTLFTFRRKTHGRPQPT